MIQQFAPPMRDRVWLVPRVGVVSLSPLTSSSVSPQLKLPQASLATLSKEGGVENLRVKEANERRSMRG